MFVTCVASPISATPVIRPEPGRDQRHPRRGQRPERHQQDQQRRDDPDLGGRADAEALGILDDLTARRDLQAGHVHRLRQREQRLAGRCSAARSRACRS